MVFFTFLRLPSFTKHSLYSYSAAGNESWIPKFSETFRVEPQICNSSPQTWRFTSSEDNMDECWRSWPWIYDLFQCLTPQPPLPPSPWGGYIITSTLHPTSCLRLWWDESKRKTQERHWKSPNPAGLHSVSYLFLPSHTTSLLCLVTATTLFQDNRPASSMKTAGRLLWIDDCEGGACNCLPRDQEEPRRT